MLNGIDISGWQSGIDVTSVDADFVIVKATGGTSFVNPDFRRQIDQAIASGKLVGCYHFAGDNNPGSWEEEAAHFLSTVSDYVGRAVMVLDWEADATEWPVSWAENWLQRVADSTGSTPWFYSYSSYINSHDCSSIARFPLWIAAYYAGYEPMGYQDDPPLFGGTGAWSDKVCYQYSSTGDVGGYDGRLDINKFYGSRDDFAAFYGGSGGEVDRSRIEAMVNYAIAIAEDDSHGYSWSDRWDVDRDCSSLMYDAADHAGYGVGRGPDKTRYTGTMEADFSAAGFSVLPYGGELVRGDILLNGHHTEMYIGDGMNVGAHIAETGDVYGEPGDQTGYEISIAPNPGGFDVILRPPVDKISRRDDEPMQFIYRPDGLNELRYHDGTKNVRLSNADQPEAINMVYKRCTGRDIPCFELGTPDARWGARFEQCFPMVTASDEWGGTAR